jgi:hypothetical protein
LNPHDFPPWAVVYQQAQRWIAAGVFEALVHQLQVVRRAPQPPAFKKNAIAATATNLPGHA